MGAKVEVMNSTVRIKAYAIVLAVLWTFSVGAALLWDLYSIRQGIEKEARSAARAALHRDLLFRRWMAGHGGVYVPATAITLPNPYLGHLPERDILTPSGRQLTLLNPAYAMRQVYELAVESGGLKGHITSLKPIRPENGPDPWEKDALESFGRGSVEAMNIATIKGRDYMRFMVPMFVEQQCLGCHSQQGYKLGDLRGGVAVSVPMAPYLQQISEHDFRMIVGYGTFWFAGLAALTATTRRTVARVGERERANRELRESEARVRLLLNSTAEAIYGLDTEGRCTFVNPACIRLLGYERPEELVGRKLHGLMHHTRPDGTPYPEQECRVYRAFLEGSGVHIDDELMWRKDGSGFPVEYWSYPIVEDGQRRGAVVTFLDITERRRAEDILREKQHQLDNLLANVDAVVLEGNPLDIYYVGGRTEEILGYPLEEWFRPAGGPVEFWSGLLHPDDTDKVTACANAIKEGRDHSFEYRLRHADGEYRWFFDTVTVESQDGVPVKARSIMVDITESKRAQRAVRESGEKFRTIFDQSGIGMVLIGTDGAILECNASVAGMYGGDQSDLIGKRFIDLIPTEECSEARETFEHLASGKRDYHKSERRYIAKNGTTILTTTGLTLLRDGKGSPQYLIAVVEDIGERKQAEEARLRLETAIEQAGESIVITDGHGAIQYVNPSFELISGYRREEVIGRNPRILKSGTHDAAFYRDMWACLTAGEVWKGHLINRRKDGVLFEEEATISPVLDRHGCVMNYVAVKRDVTEEVQLAARLRQSQKLEAIGTLAGGIAHDFNNVLAAIVGYTEIELMSAPRNSKLERNLSKVLTAGLRASDLVRQILTFSRQATPEKKPVEVRSIVDEGLKLLEASLPTTIDIRRRLDSRTHVNADSTQIHQVLMNLCTNAARAMGNDGGRLDVSLVDCDLDDRFAEGHPGIIPGRYVCLTVSDTGCGMVAGTIERIFEPFFTTRERGEGTGLGLSVAHGIVKDHRGAITVESTPGQGTSFSVFLPALVGAQSETITHNGALPRGSERIMFVDDEEFQVDVGRQILESLGYTVTAVTDSQEALAVFESRPGDFDVIITDMTMPRMPGDVLARRAMLIRPEIPVVLCTGYSERITEKKAEAIGIKRVIMKPFGVETLANAVRTAVDGKGPDPTTGDL